MGLHGSGDGNKDPHSRQREEGWSKAKRRSKSETSAREPTWGKSGRLLNPRVGVQSCAPKSGHESTSQNLGDEINPKKTELCESGWVCERKKRAIKSITSGDTLTPRQQGLLPWELCFRAAGSKKATNANHADHEVFYNHVFLKGKRNNCNTFNEICYILFFLVLHLQNPIRTF